MAPPEKTFRVGIICGSTRSPRAGPQITEFVYKTIETHLNTHKANNSDSNSPPTSLIALELVDVAAFGLPIFDEPDVPQAITDPAGYAHQHTRDWSARIAPLDAFVFVTPQYNWGIPGGLKNAIDYLFNEWAGKPAMVVSYGGHGGGKAAGALRTVLLGLRMRTPGGTVGLSFPDRGFGRKCALGEDLGLGAEGSGVWERERDDIVAVWEEVVGMLTG